MLVRDLKILPYEFGEIFQLMVGERNTNTGIYTPLFCVRVPLGNGNIEHYMNYSVSANKGVVPNQIAKEMFNLMNFFDLRDWRLSLDKYSDFCDCKL